MGDVIQFKREKNEIMDLMNNATLCPKLSESTVGVTEYTQLSWSTIASYGAIPLVEVAKKAISGTGKSGLYFVDTAGKSMFNMKQTGNFIGSLKTVDGLVGGGQAQMIPIAFDPMSLAMTIAVASVTQKLDEIKAIQEELLDFMKQKEKSELKGNLTFLYDVYENLKYNWNHEMYKNNHHTIVLAIKKESEAKIAFYREQIISKVNKKSLLHSEQTVKKQLQEVQEQFKDYELALYALGFSTFLDVMLSDNFNEEYLESISNKLEDYAKKYRELYAQCYKEIESYFSTSIQSKGLKGLSKGMITVGKLIEKIPVVGDAQVDETLITAGEKIDSFDKQQQLKMMEQLIEHQSSVVNPFIENLKTINRINNQSVQLVMDEENLYIGIIGQ